jgi:hypothetical protein
MEQKQGDVSAFGGCSELGGSSSSVGLTMEMIMTLGVIFPERGARSEPEADEGAAAAGVAASARRSDEASVRGDVRKRILALCCSSSVEGEGRKERERGREKALSCFLQGRLKPCGAISLVDSVPRDSTRGLLVDKS